MQKQKILITIGILFILLSSMFTFYSFFPEKMKKKQYTFQARIMAIQNNLVTVQDKNHTLYTFQIPDLTLPLGGDIAITYTGLLDPTKSLQTNEIISYREVPVSYDLDGISTYYLDDGIFRDYYILAQRKLAELTLEEKIGQLLLVRYPDEDATTILEDYPVSGFVLYEKDFDQLTEKEVQQKIQLLQKNSKIPLLIAVDEEGGAVVRVSSHPNLAKEKFQSPQELYQTGGLEKIAQDTKEKSYFLNNLGINLNLAPVVDVSTNPLDYIYSRTLGKETSLVAQYAKTVIENSKNTGVSYTLKHFPGYGNNKDSHDGSVIDKREYDDIQEKDLPPFQAGIEALAEAILVSHVTVENIDSTNPASLSSSIHNLLRKNLAYTGVIMTDDLAMKALEHIDNVYTKALLAGNDLLMVTDYKTSFQMIKEAVSNQEISEELINQAAFRILAWKYYKGLMFDISK